MYREIRRGLLRTASQPMQRLVLELQSNFAIDSPN